MNILLKVEYAALLLLSIFLFSSMPFAWWWYLVLFLTPDIGMLGYLVNPRVGAWTYNAFHFLIVAIGFYIIGYATQNTYIELAGVVLMGHIGFDRMLGYGLKYEDSFKHTHLGAL